MKKAADGSKIKVRLAAIDDCARLIQIHESAILISGRAAYSQDECESWATGLKPENYVEAMTIKGQTFLVAETGNKICGFCSCKDDEIIGLYVDPETGRSGIGSLLLEHAEKAIEKKGHRSIRIDAALSALDFYMYHGYSIQQRRSASSRGGLDLNVCDLTKTLPGQNRF